MNTTTSKRSGQENRVPDSNNLDSLKFDIFTHSVSETEKSCEENLAARLSKVRADCPNEVPWKSLEFEFSSNTAMLNNVAYCRRQYAGIRGMPSATADAERQSGNAVR